MKCLNKTHLKLFTFLGLLLSLIPVSIFILWIKSINKGTTHFERVSIFKEYFPDFLQGRWDTTIISISFSVYALLLSGVALKLSGKFWKTLNILVLLLSFLLLSLNLFSMM